MFNQESGTVIPAIPNIMLINKGIKNNKAATITCFKNFLEF